MCSVNWCSAYCAYMNVGSCFQGGNNLSHNITKKNTKSKNSDYTEGMSYRLKLGRKAHEKKKKSFTIILEIFHKNDNGIPVVSLI